MGGALIPPCRGSAIRPFHRWSISTRDEISSLAARQKASRVHHGSGETRKSLRPRPSYKKVTRRGQLLMSANVQPLASPGARIAFALHRRESQNQRARETTVGFE